MTEAQIEESILQFLQFSRWLAWKNISGGFWDSSKKCFRKHKSKYVLNGVSDIIAVKNGRVLFLEVKTKVGKQLDTQIIFEKLLTQHGGEYYIVRSVKDVVDIISCPRS